MATATLEALEAQLDYNRVTAEDCRACYARGDLCAYHTGVEDGVSWLTILTRRLAADPELADVLPMDRGAGQ